MNFDDLIDAARTFAAINYSSRKLTGLRLDFDTGRPVSIPLPDDVSDDSADRHPVERAILAALEVGIRVPHKELKIKVMRATKCATATFNRYLRRLKDDEAIDVTAEGYGIKERE
jgi:hypothetical protein